MSLKLEELFPNANAGLANIGFFFGAGTSKCAGYPLTFELTKSVINNLEDKYYHAMEESLNAKSLTYDKSTGIEDIEVISDAVQEYAIKSGDPIYEELENIIRAGIYNNIKSVDANLDFHVEFLKALKKRFTESTGSVLIITTNYDLNFERAAAIVKIPIHNCFQGVTDRYFEPESINWKYGRTFKNAFFQEKGLNIKLIKLHGSISWCKKDGEILEYSDQKFLSADTCSLILPNLKKVRETLEPPFDQLFRIAREIIKRECKYMVCCGYSFRDKHINEQIFLPYLKKNELRLTALLFDENNIDEFKTHKSFNFISKDKFLFNSTEIILANEYYKFENFIKVFI